MLYTLSLQETKDLKIEAAQMYSEDYLYVKSNETYAIWFNENQTWNDWFKKIYPPRLF